MFSEPFLYWARFDSHKRITLRRIKHRIASVILFEQLFRWIDDGDTISMLLGSGEDLAVVTFLLTRRMWRAHQHRFALAR